MARLILINGAPAIGKSTLARRYVDDHPLSLNLDIDMIRSMLGRWRRAPAEAGRAARAIALGAARTHLASGNDVVIPQLVARPEFLDDLARLADEASADFHEIMLAAEVSDLITRYAGRGPTVAATHDFIDADELATFHQRLTTMLAARPWSQVVQSRTGDLEQTYRELIEALDSGGDTDGLVE